MIRTLNRLFLAPLDNVNCTAFRLLCKECGAGLVSTPMINAPKYVENPKEYYWFKEERPLLVQFIGHKINELRDCVKNLSNCDVVDLNAGCPSTDQVKSGNGAALLKDLPLLKRLVKTMIKHSPVPVSLKIRSGWNKDEGVKICKTVDNLGLDFITIHARTQQQGYGVTADWSVIRRAKQSIKTKIVASGDLLDPISIKKCFDLTGCDAVMIARAAINDPLIFKDAQYYLENGELLEHNRSERLNLILRFIELYKDYERFDLSELRNHCSWLVKGFKGARRLRGELGRSKSEKELINLIRASIKTKE